MKDMVSAWHFSIPTCLNSSSLWLHKHLTASEALELFQSALITGNSSSEEVTSGRWISSGQPITNWNGRLFAFISFVGSGAWNGKSDPYPWDKLDRLSLLRPFAGSANHKLRPKIKVCSFRYVRSGATIIQSTRGLSNLSPTLASCIRWSRYLWPIQRNQGVSKARARFSTFRPTGGVVIQKGPPLGNEKS